MMNNYCVVNHLWTTSICSCFGSSHLNRKIATAKNASSNYCCFSGHTEPSKNICEQSRSGVPTRLASNEEAPVYNNTEASLTKPSRCLWCWRTPSSLQLPRCGSSCAARRESATGELQHGRCPRVPAGCTLCSPITVRCIVASMVCADILLQSPACTSSCAACHDSATEGSPITSPNPPSQSPPGEADHRGCAGRDQEGGIVNQLMNKEFNRKFRQMLGKI